MARTREIVPALLNIATASRLYRSADAGFVASSDSAYLDNPCNSTVTLDGASSMALHIAHPPSHAGPLRCWTEVRAPPHHLVFLKVEGREGMVDNGTCSTWISLLDGDLRTPITEKVCSFKHIYRETTGDLMLIWYHAETTTSAERLRLKVQALRCPSTCEDRINLDRNNIVVEPVRRSGDDCSRDACFWKLCAPSETARVELHPKAYRQGQISKCDYSKVVIYDGELEGTKGQAGPMCENAYVSSAQCMFLEYRLGGFPAPRFQAFVASITPSGTEKPSDTSVIRNASLGCIVVIFVVLVAIACFKHVTLTGNTSTQTARGAHQRSQARELEETSTDRIPVPPSYSSVCLEHEGGPPPYPAEQFELHESRGGFQNR